MEAFRVSKFYPKCYCDRLQQVGLFTPGRGSSAGNVHDMTQSLLLPPHTSLTCGIDAFRLKQWDLGCVALSGQLSAGVSSSAVRSHYRAQNLPSLYQAVFLGISLP